MNCNTGHLVRQELLDGMAVHQRKEYTAVPKKLASAARIALGANSETMVDLNAKSELSDWAHRTKNQRKRDRKRGK